MSEHNLPDPIFLQIEREERDTTLWLLTDYDVYLNGIHKIPCFMGKFYMVEPEFSEVPLGSEGYYKTYMYVSLPNNDRDIRTITDSGGNLLDPEIFLERGRKNGNSKYMKAIRKL